MTSRLLLLIGLLAVAPASSRGQAEGPARGGPPPGAAQDTLTWERVGDRPITPFALAFDGAGRLYGSDGLRVHRLDLSGGFPGVWELRNDEQFVDAMIGLGADTLLAAGSTLVRRSTDGGLTWTGVYADGVNGNGGAGLIEVPPGTPHAGTLLLAAHPVAVSLDRGATWEPRGHMPGEGNEQGSARALAAPGGLVAGGRWGAAYSEDDGYTWTESSLWAFLTYLVEFLAVAERPGGGQRVVALGYSPLEYNTAWYSDDAGVTWLPEGGTALPQPSVGHGYGSAAGLVPVGGSTVLAVLGRGVVYRSDDGGATWAEAGRVPEVGYDNAVRAAVLGPDGRVYVGLSGFFPLFEGAWVWRTVEAVPVPAEPGPVEPPAGLGLSVVPNPARGSAEVALVLPEAGVAEVGLYDVLGRRVALLYDGLLGAGRHTLSLDTERLPSGVYVVRVTSSGTVASQRLTLLH